MNAEQRLARWSAVPTARRSAATAARVVHTKPSPAGTSPELSQQIGFGEAIGLNTVKHNPEVRLALRCCFDYASALNSPRMLSPQSIGTERVARSGPDQGAEFESHSRETFL